MRGSIFKNDFDYLDIMKDVEVQDELEQRGLTGKIVGNNLMVCCPFHNDSKPSFGVRIDGERKGVYQCFSCGETGNFFHLISHIDEVSFIEAVKKFKKIFEVSSEKINELQTKFKDSLQKEKFGKPKIKVINKKIMEYFPKPKGKYLRYLLNRGIRKDTIKKFGIRMCKEDIEEKKLYWKERVIIPLCDSKGRLISIVARHISTDDGGEKVRKIKGGERKKILYGIQFIKKGTELVLVEGEFDCIFLQQFGIPAVSLGTIRASDEQIRKIVKFTNKVAMCLDGDAYKFFDKSGVNVQKKMYDALSKYVSVRRIKLPKDKDPNDLGEEEVKKIFKEFV